MGMEQETKNLENTDLPGINQKGKIIGNLIHLASARREEELKEGERGKHPAMETLATLHCSRNCGERIRLV